MKPLLPYFLTVSCALSTLAMPLQAEKPSGGANATFKLTTKSGKVYEQARVVATVPDGIRIMHADGAAKIPFTELSEELRREHGYDPDKAATYKAEQDQLASDALAQAVRLQKQQMAEAEAEEFRLLHLSVLTAIQKMEYDYPKLDAVLLTAIEQYRTAGKKEWVKILQEDRETLKQRELQRPALEAAKKSQALEAQNQRLQDQINQLRNQQQTADNTRRVTYYANPISPSYYYNPSPPIYIQPPPVVVHPPVCPTPTPIRPVPVPHNGTGAGGYVPPSMQGGLDGHGGYTPPELRR